MRKKTLAAILALTIIITMFMFCAMYLTRPESSAYSLQVLEEARQRQNKSLISVTAPLNTDTSQMSQEERIAAKVAEILSADAMFASDVKDVIIEDVETYMEVLGKEVGVDVLESAKAYVDGQNAIVIESAAKYSDSVASEAIKSSSENTIKLIEDSQIDTASLIDAKIEESFNNVFKSYVSDEVKAFSASDRAYTDSQASKVASTAADKILKDSKFISSVASLVVSKLGISENSEYILEVDRLVEEVLKAAAADPALSEVFNSAIDNYYLENGDALYNSFAEKFFNSINAMTDEELYSVLGFALDSNAVSADKIDAAAASQPIEVEKERVSAPVFDAPNTSITDEELLVERSSQRQDEINKIKEWLGE